MDKPESIAHVVLLPVQVAELTYIAEAAHIEKHLYPCLEALTTLSGGVKLIRRDCPPQRWQISPFASPDEIQQQHQEWGEASQTNWLFWPVLSKEVSADGIQSSDYRLTGRLVNTAHYQSQVVVTIPLDEVEETKPDYWAKLGETIVTAMANGCGVRSPELLSIIGEWLLSVVEGNDWVATYRQYPDNGWLAYKAAEALSLSQPVAAIDAYHQALKTASGDEYFQAECWLDLGRLYARQVVATGANANYSQAISAYNQALSLWAESPVARLSLGYLYESQGELAKASSVLLAGLSHNPLDSRLHVALARVYSKQHAWQLAIQHYQYQHQFQPNDPWPLSNIAMAYLQLEQPEQAKLYFEKTAALDPDGEAGATAQLIMAQL